jgi:hypothetical protein
LYKVLVGKPKGKRPVEGLRRRCKNGIEIDLGEIGWKDVEWIDLCEARDGGRLL